MSALNVQKYISHNIKRDGVVRWIHKTLSDVTNVGNYGKTGKMHSNVAEYGEEELRLRKLYKHRSITTSMTARIVILACGNVIRTAM